MTQKILLTIAISLLALSVTSLMTLIGALVGVFGEREGTVVRASMVTFLVSFLAAIAVALMGTVHAIWTGGL